MDHSLVETGTIDRRYEHCRARHSMSEGTVLISVRMNGIKEPLLGILKGKTFILLDGFKRLRAAQVLNLDSVPFKALANHEAAGFLALIKLSNARSLTMLEQAMMIDELTKVQGLSVTDISKELEKSPSWVSMRHGILAELSKEVRERIMNGDFPMYAYTYHIRPFIRMKKATPKEVDQFVGAVAKKGLSMRDIEALTKAFFRGGEDIRRQIVEGSVAECLLALRPRINSPDTNCSKDEQRVIVDLGMVSQKMKQLSRMSPELRSPDFLVRAELLCEVSLRIMNPFQAAIRSLYDRARSQACSPSHGGEGDGHFGDLPPSQSQSQHGPEYPAAQGRKEDC